MDMSETLFGFEHIEVSSEIDSTLILEEIRKEVEECLQGESDDTELTEFLTFQQHCTKKFKRNLTNYLTVTVTRNVKHKD